MRLFAFFLFLALPAAIWASPAEEPVDDTIPILESFQNLLGGKFNYAANRLDAFFATERADDEFGRSRIRFKSQFILRERAISSLNNQYRLNLRLPNLEQKFKYDFASKKKKKENSKTEASAVPILPSKNDWIFNADMGVSLALPPKLVTRARLRKNIETGPLTHRFVEQLTYITDESGLLEETGLNSDHAFTDNFLFRFLNEKKWQVLKKKFTTNHGPTWLHSITDNDAFVYGTTMQTIINNGVWYTNNYRISVNYRRNLYKQWFYLDVIPGLDFPKIWSFRRTPFITFQIELLFGG
jgi:hypothetical protein